MTDTGVDDRVCWLERMRGVLRALLLEANHDLDMLRLGAYPWAAQAADPEPRTGHLSNLPGAGRAGAAPDPALEVVVGMHLSRENNTPAAGGARSSSTCWRAPGSARGGVHQGEPRLVDLGEQSLVPGWVGDLPGRLADG